MKSILAIIVFILFLFLLWFSNNRYEACCAENNNVIEEAAPIVKQKDGPLVYDWDSGEAITNDLWEAKKTEILSGMADGKILQVVGPYFQEEGEEMGITRAKAAFAKLGNTVTEKVEFGSKLVSFYDEAKTKPFAGTQFNWLTKNENIQEIDNKTLIYFPSNSTKKVSNENILNYLKSVATLLGGNDQKIELSGHTDNVGKPASNKKLALGRAESIKSELVRLGVDENRVSVVSFGEEKPIETNETEAGRQKNRRVELEIK